MIDRIKQTVETYLNTDNRGNFTPEKFDAILHNKVLERYEDLFFEFNRMLNRQNRGLVDVGSNNTADHIEQKIQHYLMPDTTLTYNGGVFEIPTDLRYFDTVLYNNEAIELCRNNREYNILKTQNPTVNYPIGLKVGNTLKILPATIVDSVTITYLRNPIRAKWTYVIVGGVEQYNPSANDFADVDIHPSEEADITVAVLKGFGINLKEEDIVAISQSIEDREFNENNVA